jgi:hypothetical protein
MSTESINPGDYYEDVFFHPCLCTSADGESVSGISLIDGSTPRTCDLKLSGVRRLTLDQVVMWKQAGPQDLDKAWVPLPDYQWWWPKPVKGLNPGDYLEHLFSFSLLFIRNHALDVLGGPIVGWFSESISVSYQANPPSTQIQYRVNGSKLRGTVTVTAQKEARMWPISRIVLDTGSGTPRTFEGESVRGCGRAV